MIENTGHTNISGFFGEAPRNHRTLRTELIRLQQQAQAESTRVQKEEKAINEDADLLAILSFHTSPLYQAARQGLGEVEIELMDGDWVTSSPNLAQIEKIADKSKFDPSYLEKVTNRAAQILADTYRNEGVSAEVIKEEGKVPKVLVSWSK